MHAPAVWSYATGSGVKILIMDSGVDSTAADLSVPVAWRCVNGGLSTWDQLGHGTHVAGIATALNNSIDVVGVAHGAYLISANIDVGGPDAAEVACSIDVARVNGVFVANMSFGLSPTTAVTDAINGGYNNDNMLFVAAAGNNFGGAIEYPASLANVIAVNAVDSTKTYASFGAAGAKMELAAPGVNILSTALPGGFLCANGFNTTALCSGTSMAAPHVTGAAALIKAYNPSWTNAQVRARLTSTATDLGAPGRDSNYGYGLINLSAAIP